VSGVSQPLSESAIRNAGHESALTTGLYHRRNDSVALDEVERVVY